MDILPQYKQEHPEKFQEKKAAPLTDTYGREYSGMVALVIRLSGGRIKNLRQANTLLLWSTIGITIITITFFLIMNNSAPSSKIYSPVAAPTTNP